MKKIQLTQEKAALVDDEDFDQLSKYRWFAIKYPTGKWYAARQVRVKKERGRQKMRRMHHDIIGFPSEGFMVDHKNRNGLDNRRKNLRICSRGDNVANSSGSRNRKSRYKGVYPNGNNWQVSVRYNCRLKYVGSFKTEEQAALAYDAEINRLRGKMAVLNFPNRRKNHGQNSGLM